MFALCAAVILASRAAGSEPRVVIVETKDAPSLPGLAAQVQLHAGRAVAVTTTQERSEGSLTFTARASQIVDEHDATIVVWVAAIEGADASQRSFLVYAAGRWPGRALIELVRLDAQTPAGEIERTVALKISGLFDTIIAPRPIGVALGVPVSGGWRSKWRLEVSGSIVRESGDRGADGRLALSIDRRWCRDDWTIAAGLGAHWQPSGAIHGDAGVVSINELGPELFVTGGHRLGSWSLFARPHLSASWLLADGTSRNGPRGSATVFSPSIGLDVGATWALSDTVELVIAVGADSAVIQQEFLVDGTITADLRHTRANVTLGVSIPLR
jgi:hypothetical protein